MFNRPTFDGDDDEFLIESFDGNMIREWRALPNSPWSYSRMSRVFEDKNDRLRTPRKSLVLTGNVNVHGNSKTPSSLSYDCRTSMVGGKIKNRNCLDKTRLRRNRMKLGPGPPR